ncbi:hypothetical protein MMC07_008522 [Pseudocyphellaria aurata]|nr:hypothetical protein [Pseudocyphellaria aurata]
MARIPDNAEIIDLDSIGPSDDENAVLSHSDLSTMYNSTKSEPETAALSSSATTARDPSPSDRARLLQIQRQCIARAFENNLLPAPGAISNGCRPLPDQSPTAGEEDQHAWMNVNVEFDTDAAAKFADLKSTFMKRKQEGLADWEDEIEFLRAKRAEKARLRRLKADYERSCRPTNIDDIDENQQGDDELFVSQQPFASMRKRPHQAVTANENDDPGDAERDDFEPNLHNDIKPRSKRRIAKEKEHEKEASMLVGIEDFLVKETKRQGKKAKASKKAPDSRQRHKKSLSTRKNSKSTGVPSAKKKSKMKKPTGVPSAKKKSKVKRPKPGQPGYFADFASLIASNVYEDANRNIDRPDLAVVTHTDKGKALKAFLAGVPLDDRGNARGDKTSILNATKTLGNVRADGNGRWRLRGMKSSLLHHQVQGAAWMRERETQDVQPLGGILADAMGLGKTVMTIAAMISNPPSSEDSQTTLIVCTPALVTQWRHELDKHAEPKLFSSIIRYQASTVARMFGTRCEAIISKAQVVLTTYQEVLKSYPKYNPPKEVILPEMKEAWWTKTYDENRGLLHKIHFYRVVLDEAQAIKNHRSQTSRACRALMSKHRWALSGTPVQNALDELYPYFKFLRVQHTGSYDVFKENFCGENESSQDRLQCMLKQLMIRRTHSNLLFGAPILKLPEVTQRTYTIEFNAIERIIYEAVSKRYIQHINNRSRAGTLERSYRNVLTMLLRLRQLTAHPFLIQETVEDIFEIEDVENIWQTNASGVAADDSPAKDMLKAVREMIAEKDKPTTPMAVMEAIPPDDQAQESRSGQLEPALIFEFRTFLRALANSSKWLELKDRSLCHRCRDTPDEPWVTDCLHLYCKECLMTMAHAAAEEGEDSASCVECGHIYAESRPCTGLAELEMRDGLFPNSKTPQQGRSPNKNIKWVNAGGRILRSSKTAAVQAQIEKWLEDDPRKKIIVFSQFHTLQTILGMIFKEQEWNYCMYHGKMSSQEREKAIESFRDDASLLIMIASLKCGGIGLNLTMASRVLCVDLWWNNSVEQQAFCRVLRYGQESETFITRIVVKNTVDEKLQAIQEAKTKVIDGAIDDERTLERLSLTDLMRLFGTVEMDEDHRPFILVDDEDEFENIAPQQVDHP